MKKNLQKLFVLTVLAAVILTKPASAQVDPHFSQYFIHPMSMNPAFTGAIEGDYRVSSVFRSQYSNTLTTEGLSGEIVTNKNTNFGINILNQGTSDKAYNYTNAYLSMAYTGVRFGPHADHYLVMALQIGFIQRKFDVSKLQYGSQWQSGIGYDPSSTSGETFTKPSVASVDAGAGIAYYDATPNKTASLFGGIAAFHITRPNDPFLSGGDNPRLDVRYNAHVGVRIIASDLLTIVPTLNYSREGDAQEKMAGAYFQMYASENTDVMFGAYYRVNDAIAPFAGVYYKGLTIGVSYDVNATSMSAGAVKGNSLELSISYVGKRKNGMATKAFYCPRF